MAATVKLALVVLPYHCFEFDISAGTSPDRQQALHDGTQMSRKYLKRHDWRTKRR